MGRIPSQPHVEPAAFRGTPLRRSSPGLADHSASPTVIDMQQVAEQVSERIGSAAQFLRQAAERLGAEARSDALEVGFMVARRILETDLTANVEHLVDWCAVRFAAWASPATSSCSFARRTLG